MLFVKEVAQASSCQNKPPVIGSAQTVPVNSVPPLSFPLPATELTKVIHQRTDGNPLFMVATVEHFMRERVVVAEGRKADSAKPMKRLGFGEASLITGVTECTNVLCPI